MTVELVKPYGRQAKQEIGLGMPPDVFGSNVDAALGEMCSPSAKVVIVEDARWRVDVSVADTSIPGTFGDRINVWGTSDGQPPQGVTTATNTLAVPGMPAADMIIRGISIRVLVCPEARLIRGNYFTPGAVDSIPGSPDVFTANDVAQNALGLSGAQGAPVPAELLYGLPTWKAAFAFINAYEFALLQSHQERLIQEPLTAIAQIQPFAEAEAAGNAFSTNQDVVLALNQRLVALGMAGQFMPTMFKRLGSVTVGAANAGIFEVTREEDASISMFGGIGVPQNMLQHDPYLFSVPMWWPRGQPIAMEFQVNDEAYQAEFQRWLSVTGGVGGQAGIDLALPFSQFNAAFSGNMPTTAAANAMLEQTLDAAPTNVPQQIATTRAILKAGPMVFEVGLIGMRVRNPKWLPVIAKAVAAGAIQAPMGYGNLQSYLQ
jgi:hypothetical protein